MAGRLRSSTPTSDPEPALRIDLHTHSTASDGTDPPAELVRAARLAGLDVVALTDHDTTAGIAAAAAAVPAGLTLVAGAEISCRADRAGGTGHGTSLHLLAYLFDPDEPRFASIRRQLRDSRVGRAERIVDRLRAAGHPVSWQRVRQLAGGTVGRPHVARVLVEAGLVDSVAAAFGPQWLGQGGPFYVPKLELDPVAAVRLVRGAGGVPVFAHPRARTRGAVVEDATIAAMAAAGLAGLEVDHPDHDDAARRQLRGLADQLGLLATGSSDYHGEHKAVRLGAETTSVEVYAALVGQATGGRPVAG